MRAISRKQFTTPQEAESAFYDALESLDLEALMAVWAIDEEVICIHPNGPRLEGWEAVREGWRQILSGSASLRIRLTDRRIYQGMLYSVHVVQELVGNPEAPTAVVATNAYLLTDGGWRMILHHASPLPPGSSAAPAADDGVHILH